jgi:hypothetical protein
MTRARKTLVRGVSIEEYVAQLHGFFQLLNCISEDFSRESKARDGHGTESS